MSSYKGTIRAPISKKMPTRPQKDRGDPVKGEPCPKCGSTEVYFISDIQYGLERSKDVNVIILPSDLPAGSGASPKNVECVKCGHRYESYIGLH